MCVCVYTFAAYRGYVNIHVAQGLEEMKQQRGVRVNEFLDDGPNAHDPCMDVT